MSFLMNPATTSVRKREVIENLLQRQILMILRTLRAVTPRRIKRIMRFGNKTVFTKITTKCIKIRKIGKKGIETEPFGMMVDLKKNFN